jgi:hypothetical protein
MTFKFRKAALNEDYRTARVAPRDDLQTNWLARSSLADAGSEVVGVTELPRFRFHTFASQADVHVAAHPAFSSKR